MQDVKMGIGVGVILLNDKKEVSHPSKPSLLEKN